MRFHLYTTKEVASQFGLQVNIFLEVVRYFGVGKKLGRWYFNAHDIDRLHHIIAERGRSE